MRVRVIVASNRAAAGVYEDTSGPLLAKGFAEHGFNVDEPVVVGDGEPVRAAMAAAVEAGVDLVVTSGGTGLTSTDHTPELTRELIDREAPGIAEAIRMRGLGVASAHLDSSGGTPYAMLSRGIAGVASRTLIVNLAGSRGAAKDGLAVLAPIARHVIEQLRDGDHPREEQ